MDSVQHRAINRTHRLGHEKHDIAIRRRVMYGKAKVLLLQLFVGMCVLFDIHDPDRSRLIFSCRLLSLFRELASQLGNAAKHGAPKLTKGRDTGAPVQDASPPSPVITSVTLKVEAASPVRPEPMKPTPVRCVIRSVPVLDRTRLFLARASRMCNARGGFR